MVDLTHVVSLIITMLKLADNTSQLTTVLLLAVYTCITRWRLLYHCVVIRVDNASVKAVL